MLKILRTVAETFNNVAQDKKNSCTLNCQILLLSWLANQLKSIKSALDCMIQFEFYPGIIIEQYFQLHCNTHLHCNKNKTCIIMY